MILTSRFRSLFGAKFYGYASQIKNTIRKVSKDFLLFVIENGVISHEIRSGPKL